MISKINKIILNYVYKINFVFIYNTCHMNKICIAVRVNNVEYLFNHGFRPLTNIIFYITNDLHNKSIQILYTGKN